MFWGELFSAENKNVLYNISVFLHVEVLCVCLVDRNGSSESAGSLCSQWVCVVPWEQWAWGSGSTLPVAI